MAKEDRERLVVLREELLAEWRSSRAPMVEKADARRAAIGTAGRDVAVQAMGTVFGGAVLAGLGQMVGLVPSDPLSILVIVVFTLGLLAAVVIGVHGFISSPITTRDVQMGEKLKRIDEALELLKSLDHAEGEEQ